MVIERLAGIANKGTSEAAQVSACAQLLDRGWGRPEQVIGTPAPGEGQFEIILRHITEGKK